MAMQFVLQIPGELLPGKRSDEDEILGILILEMASYLGETFVSVVQHLNERAQARFEFVRHECLFLRGMRCRLDNRNRFIAGLAPHSPSPQSGRR